MAKQQGIPEYDIPFTVEGVETTHAFMRQRQGTTPDALNIRAFEPGTGRARGGARPGTKKYFATAITGAPSIQEVTHIVTSGGIPISHSPAFGQFTYSKGIGNGFNVADPTAGATLFTGGAATNSATLCSCWDDANNVYIAQTVEAPGTAGPTTIYSYTSTGTLRWTASMTLFNTTNRQVAGMVVIEPYLFLAVVNSSGNPAIHRLLTSTGVASPLNWQTYNATTNPINFSNQAHNCLGKIGTTLAVDSVGNAASNAAFRLFNGLAGAGQSPLAILTYVGTGSHQFSKITSDDSSYFYVIASVATNTVKKISISGTLIWDSPAFPTGFPTGIAFDKTTSTLVATDTVAPSVRSLNLSTGVQVASANPVTTRWDDIDSDGQGSYYLWRINAASNDIVKLTSTLSTVLTLTKINTPWHAGSSVNKGMPAPPPPPPLVITTTSLPNGTVGTAYSQTLGGSGGTPSYTWSIASGTLPAGLTMTAAGVIAGTPTVSGFSTFVVKVQDAAAVVTTSTLFITVAAAPPPPAPVNTIPPVISGQISTNSTLTCSNGTWTNSPTSYTYQWKRDVGGNGVFSAIAGATTNSYVLTTADVVRNILCTVTAVNAGGSNSANSNAVYGPNQPPTITTGGLANGTVGIPYSVTMAVSGGTAPFTWAVTVGSLPSGLTLSVGGVIGGTPTVAGTQTFTLRVTDNAAATASTAYSITIGAAATVSANPPINTVAPVISGTISIDSTLTTTNGTWTNTPVSYTYQWFRDVQGKGVFSAILNQIASTYVLSDADSGCNVLCQVTAINAGGSGKANSNADYLTAPMPPVGSRQVFGLLVAGGSVYRFDSTSYSNVTNPAVFNVSVPNVFSAQNGLNMFFVDGAGYYYYKTSNNTMTAWAATSPGTMPKDAATNCCRLICLWRGRTVLSGLRGDPQNWFMSKAYDPFNFSYNPQPRTATMAVAGNNSPAGLLGDYINCMIPYSDDTMVFGCDHTIWLLQGDPADGGQFSRVSGDLGMSWGQPFAIDPLQQIYFFGSDRRIYTMMPGAAPVWKSQQIKQLLEKINLGTNLIRMAWDSYNQGLAVFVTPTNAALPTTNFFWEERTNAWWPDAFTTASHNPLAVHVFDGDAPDDRVILLGGRDGNLRAMSSVATDDDGTPIPSFIFLGPIQTKQLDYMMLYDLQATLGSFSGQVRYDIYLGNSPEQALLNAPVLSGIWKSGRNPVSHIQRSDHAIWIKLSSTSAWALEKLTAHYKPMGDVLRRMA